MQKITLKAEKRAESGKGNARHLRRNKLLPAVLYSKGSSIPIKLQKKDVKVMMVSGGGEHALITLELSDSKGKKTNHWALLKDYQTDPVKNELLHVDFIEISLKKKIKTFTTIVITTMPLGIKEGGILQQQLREVEIECLPTQIPDGINVDAGFIQIGHSLHVEELKTPEGVKILTDPQEVILSVSAPVVEEVAAPETTEEEAVEPELVKTKGKDEGEETEAAPEEGAKDQKAEKEQKDKKEK